MDICKLSVGIAEVLPIDKKIFEEKTGEKQPYYQEKSDALISEENGYIHFAVCPGCDNPIRIIGLYKKLKNTEKPFGKHYTETVPDLAEYNQEAYEYCPYASRKKLTNTSRRRNFSKQAINIIKQLCEYFDYAVEIISEDTGIVITNNLASSMLGQYIYGAGFLYTGATLLNVPWIFAYMSNSQNLYGRVLREGELKAALLENIHGMECNEKGQILRADNNKGFMELNFCFMHHEIQHTDNQIKEVIKFVVSKENNETVFRKTIEIDPLRFQKIINSGRPRNPTLLSLAREKLNHLLE